MTCLNFIAASRRFISIVLINIRFMFETTFQIYSYHQSTKDIDKPNNIPYSSIIIHLEKFNYMTYRNDFILHVNWFTFFKPFHVNFLCCVCKTNKRKCLLQNLFCQRSMARYLPVSFHRINIHHTMILRYISYIHAFYDVTYFWGCIDPIDDLATNAIVCTKCNIIITSNIYHRLLTY